MSKLQKAAATHLAVSRELMKRAQAMMAEAEELRAKKAKEDEELTPLIKEAVASLINGDWIDAENADRVEQKLASEDGFQASIQLLRDLGEHHRSQTSLGGQPVGEPVGPSQKQASERRGSQWAPIDRPPLSYDDTDYGRDFIRNIYNPPTSY